MRLDHAVRSVGAKRVVLDTIESLFGGLQNETILRAELRRLFRWLRDRDLTVVITGERGDTTLTRHGLEEYVTDAVIQLDHRVHDQISTRRIRVVKYRGSHHGTNEYPFLIDANGISVLPVTSLTLQHAASSERISSGLAELDEMLGGRGYYRGSTVLISGYGRHRQDDSGGAFRRRGLSARAAMPLFPVRGIAAADDPQHAVRRYRSASHGSTRAACSSMPIGRRGSGWRRTWLVMHRAVEELRPDVVVIDPMTNLLAVGTQIDVRAMLTRMIDFLKMQDITALFTSLTPARPDLETTETLISSLMDSWVL